MKRRWNRTGKSGAGEGLTQADRGARSNAAERQSASEDELRTIKEFLFRNRMNDPE